uniref:Transmembrane protein n=1 Tax=Fagus sylvatica TaxID=28930 RepID=A0A2N9IZE5_FAGSY
MDPGGGGYGGFVVVMKLSGFVAGGGDYGRFVVVVGLSGFVAGGGGYGGFVVVAGALDCCGSSVWGVVNGLLGCWVFVANWTG